MKLCPIYLFNCRYNQECPNSKKEYLLLPGIKLQRLTAFLEELLSPNTRPFAELDPLRERISNHKEESRRRKAVHFGGPLAMIPHYRCVAGDEVHGKHSLDTLSPASQLHFPTLIFPFLGFCHPRFGWSPACSPATLPLTPPACCKPPVTSTLLHWHEGIRTLHLQLLNRLVTPPLPWAPWFLSPCSSWFSRCQLQVLRVSRSMGCCPRSDGHGVITEKHEEINKNGNFGPFEV